MGRTLEELNLIDNFLFTTAIAHETYGPHLAKAILEPILQREVRIGRINSESVIVPQKPGLHGIRMDAFIQEDAVDISQGDVFDLEPDKKQGERQLLPKRSRYYHSKIDAKVLQSGRSYSDLPRAWVIFITSYDPFGYGRMVYTMEHRCAEVPELECDDGAITLFLYVHGDPGDVPEELAEIVRYMGDTNSANACSPKLKMLQAHVDELKKDPEIKEAYMSFEEYVEAERREVRDEVEGEIRQMEGEIRQMEEEIRQVKENNDKLTAKFDAVTAENDKLTAKFDAVAAENDKLTAKFDAVTAENDKLKAERDAANQRIAELEARLEQSVRVSE